MFEIIFTVGTGVIFHRDHHLYSNTYKNNLYSSIKIQSSNKYMEKCNDALDKSSFFCVQYETMQVIH
jgi:hypothetical protein